MKKGNLIRNILAAAFVAVLVFQQAVVVRAEPGDLDTTFGVGGVATDFTARVGINKVLFQSDGKIIVVGTRQIKIQVGGQYIDYLFVRRYTSTGAVESTFPSFNQGVGVDAEFQSDGKLVVVGTAPNVVTSSSGSVNANSPIVWRFNTNGSLDTTFGSGGYRFLNYVAGSPLLLEAYAGYLFVGHGSHIPNQSSRYRLTRLAPTGSINYTVTLQFTYSFDGAAFSMAVDSLSGKIVTAGLNSITQNAILRRYTVAGAIDGSFGVGGDAAIADCSAVPLKPKGLVIQPDGNILVYRYYEGLSAYVDISRNTSSGAIDPSLCVIGLEALSSFSPIYLQPDGKFFYFITGSNQTRRYFPDGTLDSSILFSYVGYGASAIQPNNRIVSATPYSTNYIELKRRLLD
jgi:uncharacterized delta-60 repeat protein